MRAGALVARPRGITTFVVTSKLSARWSAKGGWLGRCERIDARQIACSNGVNNRHHQCIFGSEQLMMIKMDMADKGVVGKIRRALFARG
jgi:hypothetical protein